MEHKCIQYSDEWARLRLGKPTASQFDKIITPGGKPTKGITSRKYMFRLVAERLLGQVMDDRHETAWMKRGSILETDAAKAFADMPGSPGIRLCGFFTVDNQVGASPDALTVDGSNPVEIKCPAPYTMIEYLVDGMTSYKPQLQGHLYVTGAKLVHFFAWHPNMPAVYEEFDRDEEYISKLHIYMVTFCMALNNMEAYARRMGTYKLAEQLRLSEEMAIKESIDHPFDTTVDEILEDLQ